MKELSINSSIIYQNFLKYSRIFKSMEIALFFSFSLIKGTHFCDFFYPERSTRYRVGVFLKERLAPRTSNSFLKEVATIQKGGKNIKCIVAFPYRHQYTLEKVSSV